jgi:hypothetical protein
VDALTPTYARVESEATDASALAAGVVVLVLGVIGYAFIRSPDAELKITAATLKRIE